MKKERVYVGIDVAKAVLDILGKPNSLIEFVKDRPADRILGTEEPA
jgi:hypothetical protein